MGCSTLALNIQWGMTGLFNIGIAGFYAIGAYTAAIATTPPSTEHLAGFGLPFVVGLIVAMAVSSVIALGIGLITLNLRTDYLAIASIGIAEIVRLIFKNEDWFGNGVRGIAGISRPISNNPLVFLGILLTDAAGIAPSCREPARLPAAGARERAFGLHGHVRHDSKLR